MLRTLTTWQTYLLLLPGLLGFLLVEFSILGPNSFRQSFSAANILWVFNILLLLAVQAYFTIAFDKATTNKLGLPSVNAVIPVAFFVFYFLYVVYSALHAPVPLPDEYIGPIRNVKFSIASTSIMVMLAYSAVSFLFVNNWLIKNRILKSEDPQQRLVLTQTYLLPMKRLVKDAVVVVIGIFVFAVVYDIVKLTL